MESAENCFCSLPECFTGLSLQLLGGLLRTASNPGLFVSEYLEDSYHLRRAQYEPEEGCKLVGCPSNLYHVDRVFEHITSKPRISLSV